MPATADMFTSPCLRFTGSMVPLTTLELLRFDPIRFSQDLAEKVQQAPKLFRNLPLVLSLEKLESDRKAVDFRLLRQLCIDQGIQLVGIKTDREEDKSLADAAGMAILQPAKHTKHTPEDAGLKQNQPQPEPAREPENTNRQCVNPGPENSFAEIPEAKNTTINAGNPANTVTSNTITRKNANTHKNTVTNNNIVTNKIVRTPVRSGQQVYASGGDLIVLAQVSAGAEILADGNIHVYAPLRGRALAGVRGNTDALIFCQSLEAELVSIAGQYKLSEDLQGLWWKKAAQISLQDEKLNIDEL
jgi:septum site-determining protein MinC